MATQFDQRHKLETIHSQFQGDLVYPILERGNRLPTVLEAYKRSAQTQRKPSNEQPLSWTSPNNRIRRCGP